MKPGDGTPIGRELGACPDLSPEPGTGARLLASLESLHFQHRRGWSGSSWQTVLWKTMLCSVTQSCLTLCNPMDCNPPGSCLWGFSRQKYWSGLPRPPPGDLPNPGLPHCRQTLYQLSHQGNSRILEWVA